jgi:hypothetical protein
MGEKEKSTIVPSQDLSCQAAWNLKTKVKPWFTYSSIYVLSIYVLFIKTYYSIYVLKFDLRTWIQYTYFEYIKQSTYFKFEYVKQSKYIEFGYVKLSTYIEFEYVLRVIHSFQFCKFFLLFVLSKACWWWVAVNMQKLYCEKRNWWLQIHFTVRSTLFSKVWFQLTFCFRSLGSFGILWARSLTN